MGCIGTKPGRRAEDDQKNEQENGEWAHSAPVLSLPYQLTFDQLAYEL
jgi:hypothetical protein